VPGLFKAARDSCFAGLGNEKSETGNSQASGRAKVATIRVKIVKNLIYQGDGRAGGDGFTGMDNDFLSGAERNQDCEKPVPTNN